jgi:hypothetical protein
MDFFTKVALSDSVRSFTQSNPSSSTKCQKRRRLRDIQVFEPTFGTVFGFFVVLPLKLRVRYHKMGARSRASRIRKISHGLAGLLGLSDLVALLRDAASRWSHNSLPNAGAKIECIRGLVNLSDGMRDKFAIGC